ncbi:MAG TPA: antibiotic biosynthesis monooxygenase family protein [Sphingobium sp.]
MPTFEELDRTVTLNEQLEESGGGPVILVNILTVDPADADKLVEAWAIDAAVMKGQKGFISTQLYRGIAGSGTFMNNAVWESVELYRAARLDTKAREKARDMYPSSLVASPHLVRPMAVAGICVT